MPKTNKASFYVGNDPSIFFFAYFWYLRAHCPIFFCIQIRTLVITYNYITVATRCNQGARWSLVRFYCTSIRCHCSTHRAGKIISSIKIINYRETSRIFSVYIIIVKLSSCREIKKTSRSIFYRSVYAKTIRLNYTYSMAIE